MKSIKKILFGALLVAPMLIPTQTKANGLLDWLDKLLDKIEHKKNPTHNPPSTTPTQGNAVPIDGGLVILLAAGLGLGAKMIHDNKKKQVQTAVI